MKHYLNLSDNDINDYRLLGEDNLLEAARTLVKTMSKGEQAIVVVDCDNDGYSAAAILLNYLHRLFPTWVENNVDWYMHAGKSHGLKDCINYILSQNYSLVLTPDSSSNDYAEHTLLKNAGIDCVVLDHHLAEKISKDAVVVNNQLCDYPNKELCGAGVVWQFCRYLDDLMNVSYANEFLDLLALALTADMMSMRSFETKYLINKGFRKENIKNPFIDYMIDKNSFALSKSDYLPA
jgi:single-stranded-DNA-specific exonuclease